MSEQMVALQRSREREDSQAQQLASTVSKEGAVLGSGKSADQLLEVIR